MTDLYSYARECEKRAGFILRIASLLLNGWHYELLLDGTTGILKHDRRDVFLLVDGMKQKIVRLNAKNREEAIKEGMEILLSKDRNRDENE
mgnify:CR=1 FL=1